MLKQTNPQIFDEFIKDKLIDLKTQRVFLGLAIYQAHKQANTVVKEDGGGIEVTEDLSDLRR